MPRVQSSKQQRASLIHPLTLETDLAPLSTSKPMGTSFEELPDYSTRYNASQIACGNIRRKFFFGITCYFSPDYWAICFPTTVTLFIAGANIFFLWPYTNTVEVILVVSLLLFAFTSSFLLTCTDPGVYPRLNPNEEDPLGNILSLVYCRVCGIRRPPRTAHCYECGVCVLEHDHHCKILGGCVGIRSLRWFVLFLVSVASASAIGLFWILRYFFKNVFSTGENIHSSSSLLPVRNGKNGEGRTMGLKGNGEGPKVDRDEAHLAAVFLLAFDIALTLTLGVMTIMYLFLVCSSVTRREMKRKNLSRCTTRRFRLWHNIKHTIMPPPSMLEFPKFGVAEENLVSLV